jgi:hypothetical protein
MKALTVIDKRRERSKRAKRWLKTVCNPSILRLLIGFGRIVFGILKIAFELLKLTRG